MTRVLAAVGVIFAVAVLASAQAPPQRYGFGTPAPRELVAALDIDVRPDGTGLPPGSGTTRDGGEVYMRRCAVCHGANGEGGSAEALVGGEPVASAPFGPTYEQWRAGRPDVPFTIGNYWPYATTIFDYVRRAMPANAPGTLTANETYGLVAWLLMKNGIVPASAVMNAETLPRVVMPAHARFNPDDRAGGRAVR